MKSKESFGKMIKALREKRDLTLREVAYRLQIDTSMLGKIEKDNRKPTKQIIERFSALFDVTEKELTIAYLSDIVVGQVMYQEDVATEILKVAEEKVKYLKTQSKLK